MTTRPAGASLIFLALIAIIITPGVPFAASAESGEGPRGRRLAQTNSVPTPDLHLVADDITDVDSSNLVQSWSDHTGNGLSLSSFVAAPKLVDGDDISTGALFNGHKAVRFGESGITGLSLPTSALQLSTSLEGMTVVAVISTDRRDALDPILFDRGYKGNRGFGIVISPAKVHMYSAMDHGGTPTTNTAAPIENGEIYVVTTQYKFAKSGVSGYQLATTQHGNLSNPDLINVTAHTWTGTGVDYSTPFVIGTQSKSDSRTSWRWLEGYVAEFRYYLQVLDQDELTAIQDGLLAKYRVEYLQRAKLTAGDGTAGNEFGVSVSINGDTMVVGAHVVDAYTGSVYVFTRDTAGDLASRWTQVAKLTAGDGTAGDWFGESVSINGDTMVVGAHGADAYTGYAYVFTRDTAGDLTSGWTQVAKLTADDGAANDWFGRSVSIDGDTMVVGALQDNDKGTDVGSAYVFTRDTAGDLASGWTQVAKLTAGDGAANDYFGNTASIDGDTVVIGANGDDDKGDDSGSAYVFTRDTAGDLASNWTQVAKLTAGDGAADDQFARSVSNEGDTIVIGAYRDDDDGSMSGSAYVFTRDTAGDPASGWTQVAKLTANDGVAGDQFAGSVSNEGDTIVIGAVKDDDRGTESGSVYVFRRDTAGDLASGWTQVAKLTAGDGAANDYFGDSVSIDGDTMVIGAIRDDDNSGSAYVFTLACPGGYQGARCELCPDGYQGASCATLKSCIASSDPSEDGGDGDFYCVNGGVVGGMAGSCTCTKCVAGYGGASCHIGPCDMEKACFDFNVRNGMTTPATCAWMADVAGCTTVVEYMTPSPPPPPLPISAVGGTISYADGYKIHTFTTTGPNTFTVTSGGTIEYLVVAGGGSGGAASSISDANHPGAGGGGAGGIITGTVTVDTQSYTITVGAGGAGVAGSTNPANGNNGDDSSISSLVVAKGGGGGGKGTDGVAGLSGGCGGGAGGSSTGAKSGTGGSGSIGFDGGYSFGANSGGGGGGGMGSVGGDGRTLAGNGGDGIPSSISGTLTFRGAGGAGGKGDSASASAVGGNGGGGDGSSNAASATAGTPNTGSGGGGGKDTSGQKSNGAAGGSGIVIIRYLSALPAGYRPPFRTVNERVLVQDEDGWLLMAAYNHQANTNPSLVSGTAPSSATEGFSHIWPGTHLGLTASDIAEVRFYCHSSNHNRVMHFSVNNDWVKTAILTGSVSGNSVSYWTSGTTKLDGHTANLPDSATHVWTSSGYNLLDAPFYQYGAGAWRLRDPGAW